MPTSNYLQSDSTALLWLCCCDFMFSKVDIFVSGISFSERMELLEYSQKSPNQYESSCRALKHSKQVRQFDSIWNSTRNSIVRSHNISIHCYDQLVLCRGLVDLRWICRDIDWFLLRIRTQHDDIDHWMIGILVISLQWTIGFTMQNYLINHCVMNVSNVTRMNSLFCYTLNINNGFSIN